MFKIKPIIKLPDHLQKVGKAKNWGADVQERMTFKMVNKRQKKR